MPTDIARERGEILHQALRDLPYGLLAPLLRGVRRHADQLVPGSLYSGPGACAVGMMLDELRGGRPRRRFGRPKPTIRQEAPDIVRAYPSMAHIEDVFDSTCKRLGARLRVDPSQVASTVGLWVAAEVQAEINLRHMEAGGSEPPAHAPAVLDEALFADTVARLRELRPWLSEEQATRAVECLIRARRPEELFLPPEWQAEVELQRERLACAV
ncbi:MAG: hypothetical protein M3Z33_04800 [Actinomycetota bacterium]|nr:hypothetical protein [Actinomycetota bacterium]